MTTLTDIENLAERIALPYANNFEVNLEAIAADNDIPIVYGHYEDYFLGQLVHEDEQFYIHLNLDKLPEKNAPRSRFTLAHDLGHYFIEYHRTLLQKGISLSYNPTPISQSRPKHEKEADHFASHLLMPKSLFIEQSKMHEPGMDTILNLRTKFNASIECTAIHYVKRNIYPCMAIRWHKEQNKYYCVYSDSLAQLTGITNKPLIKAQPEYLHKVYMEIEFSDSKTEYVETAAPLSKWVASIAPDSKADLTGIEQIYQLGAYGGIVFLLL